MAIVNRWRSIDMRLRLATLALLALLAGVGLPVAWYLGSPLFIDKTVDESFPVVAPAPQMPQTPAALVVAGGSAGATPTVPATPAQPPTTAVAIGTDTATTVAATSVPAAPTEPAPSPSPAPTRPPSPTAPPAGPVALASGKFGVVDEIHRGQGQATVYLLPDGRRVLRLEDFRVTNGPDLYVYLSGHPAPRGSGELHAAGDFEVARLKGNVGDQNYDLPADLDLSRFQSVVIYCKRFTTVFSTAELAAGP